MRKFIITLFFLMLLSESVTAFGQRESASSHKREKKLEISKVRLSSKTFNPSQAENVELEFEISKSANIVVSIYDQLGRQIRDFKVSDALMGKHAISWDGLTSDSKLACGNVFLYVIEAISGDGQKTVYNPAEKTGGILAKSLEFTFDKKTGKIEYVLPKTGMVRIRTGLKEGMLSRTILDWQPHTAGRHVEKWDGMNGSGLLNTINNPNLDIKLACYTLPANTIITTGETIPFPEYFKQDLRNNNLWCRKDKFLHYEHDVRNCHEPKFKVSFPKAATNENGTPVVSGKAAIRVELDESDAQYIIDKRFEVMLYVDGVFIFEIEEGSTPFTCHWNTEGFTKGPHTITVNIMSYDDHIGTISYKVIKGD